MTEEAQSTTAPPEPSAIPHDTLVLHWPAIVVWAERNAPSIAPILARERFRVEDRRLVISTSSELESQLLIQARETLGHVFAQQLHLGAVALEPRIDPALETAPAARSLTYEEHKRRLATESAPFALLDQLFQTFVSP